MIANRRLLLAAMAALTTAALPSWAMAQTPGAFDGLKKTISVDPFLATEAVGGSVTSDGMTAMLIDALVRDGRFVVVERQGLPATEGSGSGGGQMIAASAIVRGVVTKYEAAASGGNVGVSGVPIGALFNGRAGVRGQRAVMEISLRLIDTATGQVISTSSAQGSASSSSRDAAVANNWSGAALGGGTFHATPIGQAGQDAIIKAVDQIAAGMRNVPWSALVIDAGEAGVYLNAGADRNVQPGLVLNVYRAGRVLTDPSTGEVLDREMARVGSVRVETVRERVSTAVLVSGELPVRGDLLKVD